MNIFDESQALRMNLSGRSVPYLELSFLIRSERLPFWGVEELVAVDVMQELAFKGYVDPEREQEGEIRG